jgi:hypothetical protein
LHAIEPVLRVQETLPAELKSISVGLDRAAMRMFEPLPPLPERWLNGHKRRPPPKGTVLFRMPYVATLTLNDTNGKAIKTKRLAATVAEGPVEMMERLGAELRHVLDQRPNLPVIVVQDGAPELWNLVEAWFRDFDVPIEMKLIDRYHVEERLAQVAEIVERDEVARRRLLGQWRDWLDRSDRGIRRICAQIEARLYETLHGDPTTEFLRAFDPDDTSLWHPRRSRMPTRLLEQQGAGHLGYFTRYAGKMAYATARARGFPIGSGPTEGACKSVVSVRCKRSGQRWSEVGASACLHMRTLALNERLEGAIQQHARLQRLRLDGN